MKQRGQVYKVHNSDIKKRILFQKDKDACFLTYNILIILDYLKCYSEDTAFTDYKKLAYLTDFTSSDLLTNIFAKDVSLTIKEQHLLQDSYLNSSSRQNKLFLVIQSLRQRNIISINFDAKNPLKNSLFLIQQDLIKPITDKKIFKYEYENIDKFNKAKPIKGLRGLKLSTMLQKIYENKGIKIWEL